MTPGVRAILLGARRFNVLDLFKAGEQGYWYDSSDLSSMYQESTGVTPAYAPGQGSADCPVGLRLDKRFSLARGAELWADGSVTLTGESTKASAGVYRVYSAAGAASAVNVPSVLVSGKWYEVTLTIDSIATAGTGIKLASTAATPTWTTTGAKRAIILANATSASITINSGVATDYQISGVSFKLLDGNHASQSVAGSRPTLSARYNLLLATATLSTQSVTTVVASYKLSFTGTGTVTLSGTSTAGPLVGTGASDRVSLTFTPTAGTLTLTVTGSVTLADLRLSADAALAIPAYQSVTNANTYDTAGFPWYLKPDGFDDGMVTNTIDFTGTDKMTVWAGVTKLSDAAGGSPIELGTNSGSVAGSFSLQAPNGAAANNYYALVKGAVNATSGGFTALAPTSNVITQQMNLAGTDQTTTIQMRSNGAAKDISGQGVGANPGGGAFVNAPIYLFRRAGTSLPFNGRDYGQIVRGAASTASQIANAERYIARAMGLSF
jgi:hypothetical protein